LNGWNQNVGDALNEVAGFFNRGGGRELSSEGDVLDLIERDFIMPVVVELGRLRRFEPRLGRVTAEAKRREKRLDRPRP